MVKKTSYAKVEVIQEVGTGAGTGAMRPQTNTNEDDDELQPKPHTFDQIKTTLIDPSGDFKYIQIDIKTL